MPKPDASLTQAFADQIRQNDFPCLGAKAALAKNRVDILIADDLRSSDEDTAIYQSLIETGKRYRSDQSIFRSFAVIFKDTPAMDEISVEQNLWRRLQALSDIDVAAGYLPDSRVSSDPGDDNFAISFGGEGFFVLTLHPGASRKSRKFEQCVIIFNLHQQFEQLRDDDIFGKLSEKIVARDTAYSGSRNPMLGEHGKISSAQQYSGRAVGSEWTCPFSRKDGDKDAA